MRTVTVCAACGSSDIIYMGKDTCICNWCNKSQATKDKIIQSPYERTRAQVYATGNKWAIENFNATHN